MPWRRVVPDPAIVAVAVATLALAGCTGGDAGDLADDLGDGAAAPIGGDDAAGVRLERPEWAIGDAWTYDFRGEATTYVVTSETAADWVMETDSAERAFADAREDISRLGPQRKSDLAGSQGSDRVEFFRWPLAPDATWRTRWDGLDVDVRVTAVTAGDATFEAHLANGTLLYRYTYDAEARWFGELRRFASDGSEEVTLRLTATTRGWTGTLARWALAEVQADSGNEPVTVGGPFEVPAGTTDVWATYRFTCTGYGGFVVAVEPANPGLAGQQGTAENGQCGHVEKEGVLVDAPNPGSWLFMVDAGAQAIDYEYAILLRTRQDVAFPAAG